MCRRCGYSGFITAWRRKDGIPFAFRSDCEVATDRKISLSIPQWYETRSGEFSLEEIRVDPPKPKEPPEVTPPPPDLPKHEPKKDWQTLKADPHAYDDEGDMPW